MDHLIDFCHSELGTTITCDTVSADGFEVDNLIHPNGKLKGFRAESFVRPPLEVALTFRNPIHLSHVEFSSPVVEFAEVYGAAGSEGR